MIRPLFLTTMLLSDMAIAGSELESLLSVLRDNGTISTAQFERLITEATPKPAGQRVQASAGKGIQITSADQQSTMKIGGRVEAHAAFYNDDHTNMGDGTTIRRARLNIKGKLYTDWQYKFDYDFVQGGTKGIKDAYLAYTGIKGVELIAGSMRPFYSLEFLANSHANTFIERGLPFAFAPGWHTGAAAKFFGDNWTSESGIFGNKVGQSDIDGDDELLFSTRATWLPVKSDRNFLHLGIAALHGDRGDNTTMSFKATPESKVTKVNLVNTGAIKEVDTYSQLGLEASWVSHRFNLQGEYMQANLNRDEGDVAFDGWYIQSSYFLTDDSRRYKRGKFMPINPASSFSNGGSGAWQLALRYSELDLNDADISGSEIRNLTFGINAYMTPEIRLSTEYVKVLRTKGDDNTAPDLIQFRVEWVL